MGSRLPLAEKAIAAILTQQADRSWIGARKVALVAAIAVGLLMVGEVALQTRAYFLNGDSLFSLLFAESRFVEDPESGLTLLRPNRTFQSNTTVLRSNSLGLRSPEIQLSRAPGSWRVAVLGASTVFDPYAADNDQTFPARLEQRLQREFPGKLIEVVNAGIVGYGLEEERRMLETRVAALQPDLTVVYTGFNDFLEYCRQTHAKWNGDHRLPTLSLPDWLLSMDILKKNTVFLRTTGSRQANKRDPYAVDLGPYRAKLEALVARARELGLPLVFTTNARAYHPDQPLEEQMRLSQSDRFYTHCFDLNGLHVLYDRHNALIREVAAAHNIPLVALDEQVPGGDRYFADSHHFSAEGGTLVADTLANFLIRRNLLPG